MLAQSNKRRRGRANFASPGAPGCDIDPRRWRAVPWPMHLIPARGRVVTLCALCTALAAEARADEFALKSTRTGRYDYVFVGATLADNVGLPNGVNCLM